VYTGEQANNSADVVDLCAHGFHIYLQSLGTCWPSTSIPLCDGISNTDHNL